MATKYVSSLTGPEMDSALIDMTYHNSEAYAVGTRNGVAVGSSDVTYHNNSKYYAEQVYGYTDRAEDAAARAEAAVPAGTAGAVFFDRAQSLTTAQQSQARANIMAGGSNDNLLDNAYFVGGGSQLGDGVFPINQRAQTSYTSTGYSIDRWTDVGLARTTVTLSSSGIILTSTGGTVFRQNIPTEVIKGLLGKTVCLSVMDFGGIIYSATAALSTTMPNTAVEAITIPLNNANFSLYIGTLNAVQFYFFNSSANIGVAAVKLELGTVSTLANDAPPNFGEELRKCKRYLRYVPLTRTPAVIGGNTAVVTLNGIEMAGVPTPALISAGGARDAGGTQNITSATVTGFTYNTPTVQFALAGNLNYVIGYVYDTVVRLSCEP